MNRVQLLACASGLSGWDAAPPAFPGRRCSSLVSQQPRVSHRSIVKFSMMDDQIPPIPTSLLSSLLSYLIPTPNPPLPPDLISTALLHRHQFLPPSLDDPIAHFVHSKDAADKREEIIEVLDGVGRLMGEGEHPSLTPSYCLVDAHTLQGRLLLFSSPHYSPPPSLALLFLYEGATTGWRYHDLRLFSDEALSDEWNPDLQEALANAEERRKKAEQEERTREAAASVRGGAPGERENGEGDGVVASSDDFWSGVSSDEEEGAGQGKMEQVANTLSSSRPFPSFSRPQPTKPTPIATSSNPTLDIAPSSVSNRPSFLSQASSSSFADGGDDYWGRYGSTEDGLAPSAPPSPGIPLQNPHTIEGEESRQVWGTGGETPVSWTPNLQDQSKDEPGSYFSSSDAEENAAATGFYASGGSGRPRGRTVTGGGHSEGSYPVFPQPPFKGLTPAGSPDVPKSVGGFSMRQRMEDEELEKTRKAGAGAAEDGTGRSDGTTPSPPRHINLNTPPSFTSGNTPPLSKVVNGFHPSPPSSSSSSKRTVATGHLRSALASLLKMHELALGLESGEAAREFLEAAMEVVAEGLKGK